MRATNANRMHSALLASSMLLLAAACGDDGGPTDASVVPDAGVDADLGAPPDTGSLPADMGAADAGATRDAATRPDAGYYCTMGGTEQVEGEPVPVPEATEVPRAGATAASLRCIDRRVEPFSSRRTMCFTQCLDFLGFQPTADQVRELQIDVFPAETLDGMAVDPSYDFATLRDRDPMNRLGVGSVIRATQTSQCDSGYQIELGFLDLGTDITTETEYVIRARSRATANQTWATSYLWNFIRRLDEANQIGAVCSNNENRVPERGVTFPVVPAETLRQAIQTTGSTVDGSSDLFDGQGLGYTIVETRDCSSSGNLTSNFTVGVAPAAAAGGYLSDSGAIDAMASGTTNRGAYLGLGVGSATSTTGAILRAAVGINRDGACTEAFGGQIYSVFPDSVTYVRMNRETTIQPVQ